MGEQRRAERDRRRRHDPVAAEATDSVAVGATNERSRHCGSRSAESGRFGCRRTPNWQRAPCDPAHHRESQRPGVHQATRAAAARGHPDIVVIEHQPEPEPPTRRDRVVDRSDDDVAVGPRRNRQPPTRCGRPARSRRRRCRTGTRDRSTVRDARRRRRPTRPTICARVHRARHEQPGCRLITPNSSSVSRPGLLRISPGTNSLPTS